MDSRPIMQRVGPLIMCLLLAFLISGCGIFERDMSDEANAAALVIAEDAAGIIEDTLAEFGFVRQSVHGVVLADCTEVTYGFTGNSSKPGHIVEYESTWSSESTDSKATLVDIQAAVVERLAPLGFRPPVYVAKEGSMLGPSHLASTTVRVGPGGSAYRFVHTDVRRTSNGTGFVASLSTERCRG